MTSVLVFDIEQIILFNTTKYKIVCSNFPTEFNLKYRIKLCTSKKYY